MAFLRFLAIVFTILFVGAHEGLKRSINKRAYYGYCHDVSTSFTDDGNGDTVYLDRQRPNCGLTGMRSYHLTRNHRNDRVKYHLNCCNFPWDLQCTSEVRYTPYNLEGGGKSVYLDRHRVSCPYKGILQMFHLQRRNGGRYRIQYKCCRPKTVQQRSHMRCYNDYTPANDDGGGDMVYLDRHRPSCYIGYFLNGFHLVRPSHGKIRYNYRCCGYIKYK